MRKQSFSRLGLSVGIILPLLLVTAARANFLIEFADGRQVTVRRYVDEGRTIKIYTAQGTISFQKEDIKCITKGKAHQGANIPLEADLERPSAGSGTDVSEMRKSATADKLNSAEERAVGQEIAISRAELKRIDAQYQDVDRQTDALWEKHVQDLESGAPEEMLAENRRRLQELNREWHKLIKTARRLDPDQWPTWAR